MSVEDQTKIQGRRPPFLPNPALLTLCSSAHLGTLAPSVADDVWALTGCFSPLFFFCFQWMGSGRPGECGAAAPPHVEVALRDVTGCATAPSLVERLARVPRRSTSSAMTESVLVRTPEPSCFPLNERDFGLLDFGNGSHVLCQRRECYKGL